ncbi:hypothetical protein T4C_2485 [Trichinella pseudospiralis]|uniref:Uncharacterized protein n=1 Tax=Trichinella pseudospiralis TaxID=6337 RepID=A0A0V1GJN0_TRIPS|nr:hypothetical protein T4C_2485 [Trichinella pseudospiralis]
MQITIAIKVRYYHVEWQRCETFSEVHYIVKLLRKGVSELLRSKVNEAKKGENANDSMQITDGI